MEDGFYEAGLLGMGQLDDFSFLIHGNWKSWMVLSLLAAGILLASVHHFGLLLCKDLVCLSLVTLLLAFAAFFAFFMMDLPEIALFGNIVPVFLTFLSGLCAWILPERGEFSHGDERRFPDGFFVKLSCDSGSRRTFRGLKKKLERMGARIVPKNEPGISGCSVRLIHRGGFRGFKVSFRQIGSGMLREETMRLEGDWGFASSVAAFLLDLSRSSVPSPIHRQGERT
jgi:hypothetical protein